LTVLSVILFIAGIILVMLGANALVRGSANLAAALGTPPLVIGLTVVAFGTSSPEVVVSIQAAIEGQPHLAFGNVIGSNIFNVLFILGVSAVVAPLVVSEQVVRQDVPIMIAVSMLMLALSADGNISSLEGALLLVGIVSYTAFQVRHGMRRRRAAIAALPPEVRFAPPEHVRWPAEIGLIVIGLATLVLGSRWVVHGAVDIALALGISQLVVGLTIVAVGTSIPEVATSVAASIRGERDIAVGNVVGSNIFNIMLVLGCAATVAPGGIEVPVAALTFDLPVMIAVAIACLPIFFNGYTIHRWEGGVFVGYYVAYTSFLVLDVTQHQALPIFTWIMLAFVVPLTILTLAVVTFRAVRAQRRVNPPG
jgi:cation:H+ antiporter